MTLWNSFRLKRSTFSLIQYVKCNNRFTIIKEEENSIPCNTLHQIQNSLEKLKPNNRIKEDTTANPSNTKRKKLVLKFHTNLLYRSVIISLWEKSVFLVRNAYLVTTSSRILSNILLTFIRLVQFG